MVRQVAGDQSGPYLLAGFGMNPYSGAGSLVRRHPLRQQARDHSREHIARSGGRQIGCVNIIHNQSTIRFRDAGLGALQHNDCAALAGGFFRRYIPEQAGKLP